MKKWGSGGTVTEGERKREKKRGVEERGLRTKSSECLISSGFRLLHQQYTSVKYLQSKVKLFGG